MSCIALTLWLIISITYLRNIIDEVFRLVRVSMVNCHDVGLMYSLMVWWNFSGVTLMMK